MNKKEVNEYTNLCELMKDKVPFDLKIKNAHLTFISGCNFDFEERIDTTGRLTEINEIPVMKSITINFSGGISMTADLVFEGMKIKKRKNIK